MRFKLAGIHALSHLAHGQDAEDLRNFKHPIISTFCWYKFYCTKFYFKKFKMSWSRVELLLNINASCKHFSISRTF